MRRLTPVLLIALVLAACGGGDDGLSKDEAKVVARRAQLTAADLGSGWRKTADEKPDSSASSDKQLEKCVGKDLDVADDTLAESNTRTFERSASEVDQQQVVVTSAVLTSEDRADQLFRVIATDAFGKCIAQAFEDELKSSEEGVSFQTGTVDVSRGQVKAADHSAHIVAPFTLKIDPLDLKGQVDLVTVSSGQVFSLVFGFSLGDPIGKAKLAELGDLLVERQKA